MCNEIKNTIKYKIESLKNLQYQLLLSFEEEYCDTISKKYNIDYLSELIKTELNSTLNLFDFNNNEEELELFLLKLNDLIFDLIIEAKNLINIISKN